MEAREKAMEEAEDAAAMRQWKQEQLAMLIDERDMERAELKELEEELKKIAGKVLKVRRMKQKEAEKRAKEEKRAAEERKAEKRAIVRALRKRWAEKEEEGEEGGGGNSCGGVQSWVGGKWRR